MTDSIQVVGLIPSSPMYMCYSVCRKARQLFHMPERRTVVKRFLQQLPTAGGRRRCRRCLRRRLRRRGYKEPRFVGKFHILLARAKNKNNFSARETSAREC